MSIFGALLFCGRSEDVLLEIEEVALRAGHVEGEALLFFYLRAICDLGETFRLDDLDRDCVAYLLAAAEAVRLLLQGVAFVLVY